MDIFKDLKKHTKHHISFHTPGHCGNEKFDIKAETDITELSFSDNLLSPSGCIKAMEENIAKIYRSERALLFTNGATSCVHTVISALKDKSFLIVGEAHKSVFNILGILKADTHYVSSLKGIDEIIKTKKIDCIFITSPNYFGEIADYNILKTIKDKYNIIIIVDSSHGSHYVFSKYLPISATEIGDIVIFSLHKTLPCYTGTALICTKEKYYENLFFNRQIFHTSSPFYPSIIRAYETLKTFETEDFYSQIIVKINRFSETLNKNYILLKKDDFTRVVIKTAIAVKKITNTLEKENIFIEMTYENQLVLIVTPFNVDFLSKVAEILNGIEADKEEYHKADYIQDKVKKLVFYDQLEFVTIEKAKGRTLAKEIGLYPPGVPIIFSGEILDGDKIMFIKNNINSLFGLVNDRVVVVK